MSRRSVVFEAPRRVDVRRDDIPVPVREDGELLVRTLATAISAGTELHFYRGDLPEETVLDEALPALGERFRYPATYGYAAVGEVDGTGRRVFAFQPHVSHFVARDEDLFDVPESLSIEAATLWPSVETAVNLALDAQPRMGERVLVVGQGVIGLAATSVLARFPLERLVTVEPAADRRTASLLMGAHASVSPEDAESLRDFDVSVELSGTPVGLNLAIGATGFEGRVVVGSWYGEAPSPVALGTHFHRSRLSIISSQVSHLGSPLLSRWTKRRRMDVASRALAVMPVEELISHRFPIEEARDAYALIDERLEECLQIVLTYN